MRTIYATVMAAVAVMTVMFAARRNARRRSVRDADEA